MRTLQGLAAVLLFAGIGATQPYGGTLYSVTGNGTLWEITKGGTSSSLATLNGPSHGLTMGFDNKRVYWSGLGSTSSTIAATINEWNGLFNTTLVSAPNFTIHDLALNQNGEIVFTGRTGTPSTRGLFKWVGGTTIVTIATAAQIGSNGSLNGGLGINIFSGNYLVPNGAFATLSQIWDVAEDGTVTSVVRTPTPPTSARYSISQDKANGLIYQSAFTDYRVIDPVGNWTIKQPIGTAPDYYYALRVDRASVPNTLRRLWAIYQSGSSVSDLIHEVSDPAGAPTYTSSMANSGAGVTQEIIFKGERNIASAKIGPGAYTLNFDFPAESGNAYVVAISLSGFRPAVVIPDGRNICLAFDNATPLSVRNTLKPFFDAGPGVLGAGGAATGSIALGRDNLGLRIYMVAATMKGAQIVSISDPYVMRL